MVRDWLEVRFSMKYREDKNAAMKYKVKVWLRISVEVVVVDVRNFTKGYEKASLHSIGVLEMNFAAKVRMKCNKSRPWIWKNQELEWGVSNRVESGRRSGAFVWDTLAHMWSGKSEHKRIQWTGAYDSTMSKREFLNEPHHR